MSSIGVGTDDPATQEFIWQVLGPCFVGWTIQIFVTGASMQQSIGLFSKRTYISKTMQTVLAITLILNTLVFGTNVWEFLRWGTTVQRTQAAIWEYTIPDAYVSIPAGLTAFVVQGFFAHRAWEICNRNTFFLCYIVTCITAALVGAIGLGYAEIKSLDNNVDPEQVALMYNYITIFTELWTWAAAVTDLSYSLVIIYALYRKRTGYNMPTDNLVTRLIFATMESALMTTTFAMAAAITYILTWNLATASLNLVFLYPLPSIYTYSLVWCLSSTHRVRKEHHARSVGSPEVSTSESLNAMTSDDSALSNPFSPDWNTKKELSTTATRSQASLDKRTRKSTTAMRISAGSSWLGRKNTTDSPEGTAKDSATRTELAPSHDLEMNRVEAPKSDMLAVSKDDIRGRVAPRTSNLTRTITQELQELDDMIISERTS